MSETKSTTSGGISTVGLLGVVFITLKLLGKITWSWLWVLAPFWIPFAILLVVLIIWGIVALAYAFSPASKRW